MPHTATNGFHRVAAHLAADPALDGELLARFKEHHDEAAFSTLVRRHAAMVLGTCRRVLGNTHDAEDAFQAVFVVLIRKAHALRDRTNLGNYLYGIAFNTALKAKAMAAKRRSKEARGTRAENASDQPELLAALDEELARLPERYRAAVVLCELEGRSRREAAQALHVAEGTISSRLATAHRLLEKRLRARGFAAVSIAMLVAAQASASADALTNGIVKAVLHPSDTVSHLATGVSKMLFLHKIGLGAGVLAVLVAGIASALPSTAAKPAPEPPPPRPLFVTAPVPQVKEPAWKVEFRKIYGLREGQFVRRIGLPHPPCRAEYFRDEIRELFARNKIDPPELELDRDYTDYFTKFGWKEGWVVPDQRSQVTPVKPDEGVRLIQLLTMTTGFTHTRTDGDDELLERKVTGDFVVRAGADPGRIAAALEPILRDECKLPVSLAVEDAERDVWVLSGKYKARPLAGRKEHQIEIYAVELGDRSTGGGGSGTLEKMADHIEGFIESRIAIGKVEDAPKSVDWHFNYRSPFTAQERAEDTDAKSVMENITAQTGLTAKLEKRTIKILVVRKKPL